MRQTRKGFGQLGPGRRDQILFRAPLLDTEPHNADEDTSTPFNPGLLHSNKFIMRRHHVPDPRAECFHDEAALALLI